MTGLLLPVLKSTSPSRVVTISSLAANQVVKPIFNFPAGNYDKILAYNNSKFSNLVFALQLDQKLKTHLSSTISLSAHPGYTRTNLQRHSPGILRKLHNLYTQQMHAQSAIMGALPILRASTESDLNGGEYFGPGGKKELKGFPVKVPIPEHAINAEIGKQLWELSEKLSGIKYQFS